MRQLLIATVVSIGLVSGVAAPLAAAPCKDAKGKFVKCPPPKAAAAKRCKDAKGKFVKCGTPGAKPA